MVNELKKYRETTFESIKQLEKNKKKLLKNK